MHVVITGLRRFKCLGLLSAMLLQMQFSVHLDCRYTKNKKKYNYTNANLIK